tara:strand:+ start:39 stop:1280 length:1242 start_codon:yes stop_codon:yes gene_type:complete
MKAFDLIVIGGGASGFMGAITAAENGVDSILILEASSNLLHKVKISGGGRCNVTNATWDKDELVSNYPRGRKQLKGTFSRFSTSDAVGWFSAHGLDLVVESDGRMFPSSNTSQQVIDLFLNLSLSLGIQILTNSQVIKLSLSSKDKYSIQVKNRGIFNSKRVLISTGGSSSGWKIASELGHAIVKPVPSLFSFPVKHNFMKTCSGISVDNTEVKLSCSDCLYKQRGRVLITHLGISGPAIFRLSSFAARSLHKDNYLCEIKINWLCIDREKIKNIFGSLRNNSPNLSLSKYSPFENLPKRVWLILLNKCEIDTKIKYSSFSKNYERKITDLLLETNFSLKGRGAFAEEFVTAGGINLNEIDHRTMTSLKLKDLYFSGEVLDIDGITGGFNFQHCWSSGWLAGLSIAKSLTKEV